jgi:hypothetical protein
MFHFDFIGRPMNGRSGRLRDGVSTNGRATNFHEYMFTTNREGVEWKMARLPELPWNGGAAGIDLAPRRGAAMGTPVITATRRQRMGPRPAQDAKATVGRQSRVKCHSCAQGVDTGLSGGPGTWDYDAPNLSWVARGTRSRLKSCPSRNYFSGYPRCAFDGS